MEEDTLTLEGLGTTVRVDGRKGKNIIREYDSGTTIRLQRALRDIKLKLPKTSVSSHLLFLAESQEYISPTYDPGI